MGDATVVADLYRQHGALIHTISQQLVDAAADRLTQQIFVEAWQDRLDFNPSMGSVRNWLIRRVREHHANPTEEADLAVDRIVVAESLGRMDDVRRQVLTAGGGASNVEDLAGVLDLPVASVRGHLRRGMDLLKADLADSRVDGSDESLAAVLSVDGPPEVDLVDPPAVVWDAVVAELHLNDLVAAGTEYSDPPEVVSPDSADADMDLDEGLDAEDDDSSGGQLADEPVDGDSETADQPDEEEGDGMEALRADAVLTDLNRPIWQNPAAVILALIIIALLIAILF